MALHHKLGASTCERWGTCAGSVVLSAKASKLPPSKYAAQGTAAHTACSQWLLGEPLTLGCMIDVQEGGFSFEYSQEDNDGTVCFDHVVTYVEYIESRGVERMLVEQQVNIPGTDLFGTADCILIDPYSHMEVIDFKYGRGVKVAAKDNKQLLYYAAASFLSLPEIVRAEIPKIIVTIVQPRAPGAGIESYAYTPAEIHEFMGWLMAAKQEVEIATGEYGDLRQDMWQTLYLKPGDHCRWCPANPTCPAVQGYVVDVISGDAKLDFINETVKLPNPADLPLDVLARVFVGGDDVKDFIDKCYSLFNVYAKEGIFDPADFGLKLVEGVKHRKWINPEQTAIVLTKDYGFTKEAIYTEPKLKSPNQIEKLLGKDGKDFTSNGAIKPAGEISLAPLADRRPAVTYSKPQDDFKDVALEYQLTKSLETAILE